MLLRNSKSYIMILFITSMLFACGEDDSGTDTMSKSAAPAPAMEKSAGDSMDKGSMDKGSMDKGSMDKGSMGMDNGVIYQDEIYKNWPYQ